MIKLLIAEDQAMLLTTLATLLELEDELEVVCRAIDGQEALNALKANADINLVITDIEMPNMTGIELAEQMKKMKHSSRIIMLTTFARAGYLRRALDAGATGYLLKDSPLDELKVAIKKVMLGKRVIAPELIEDAWAVQDPLTPKERSALQLAQTGATTEEMAKRLFLTEGTVRNYLSSACNKLNAKNRIEAARIAQKKGWL